MHEEIPILELVISQNFKDKIKLLERAVDMVDAVELDYMFTDDYCSCTTRKVVFRTTKSRC